MENIKFALGLSPLNYYNNNIESFDNFCKLNNDKIEHWYISHPYTWRFKEIYTANLREQEENFKKQLLVIKNNNQKLQFALNTNFDRLGVFEIPVILFLALDFKIKYEKYKKVDSVVCLGRYAKYIKWIFPKATFTYSFCNNIDKLNTRDLKYFDTIVIGRKYLKNIEFMRTLKDKYNLKIELLLNCACHSLCNYKCFDDSCYKLQKSLIDSKGIDWCVATQSLIPSELNLYPDGLIDIYKLSTRPSTLEWMQAELDLYSGKKFLSDLDFSYFKPNFYKLICCTQAISDLLDDNIPNIDKVLEIKSEEWSNILKKDIRVW